MAKTSVCDSDPTVTVKATELKRELEKLVKSIIEDEDFCVENIDKAKETLFALKEIKARKRLSSSSSSWLRVSDGNGDSRSVCCPREFVCPLSKSLMRDPVIVSTGQTYDRLFIQKWLKAGNRTCPLTQQVLSHTILTPNHLIREMISQWCKNQGLESPDPVSYVDDDAVTEADRDHFLSLLSKMSSTLPEQKAAAKELRLLTKRMPSFRALFGESLDAITQLLNPLSESKSGSVIHPELQEDVITTLLNLSIHDSNKKLVGETPVVIPLLMEALRSGTIETKSNAAAAIFTLSALDSNKALIAKSGALKPLVDLLEMGHPLAMKDTASAIFNLCILHENKSRAVKDGVIKVIVDKIATGVHVDELLAILAMFSTHQRAVEEMGELETVSCLLRIIRENSCERNKENSIAILYSICYNDRRKLIEIREEEKSYRTISKLARDGTSRAKRKANSVLERLNRAVNLTHTA